MQLQKESRRQSMAPIDVNRASLLNAFAPSSSSQPPNKRASTFTPLTGRSNSHRRISSVSGVVDFSIDTPNGQTLTFPDGAHSASLDMHQLHQLYVKHVHAEYLHLTDSSL